MVRDEVRALRPAGGGRGFAVRFETLPGEQAQVDFAEFRVSFKAEPGVVHIIWLFSMVLGYSRLVWGRFVHRQTMQTVPACHKAAFEAFGGVPRQILYDRMKTAVRGGSVCLHTLAAWISGLPLVDHAAARSGWSKYSWSGVRPPSAKCGLTAL